MALFQSTVSHRDRKAYAKTLLLNNKNASLIQAYSTVSEFYYQEGLRKSVLYRTALTKDQLTALIDTAVEWNDFVELPILGKSNVKREQLNDEDLFASTTTINVNMDFLVKGWDIGSTSTSYLFFRFGEKTILYKVDDTIANIEGASSTSTSIA
ncbi:unnamed protein product [marine sediment metagenome]|uniref:Uncharacterized protein n=1 Tax=marine sediment metagenome TaxID=412755 RepID=X0STH4_9ZZZZ